MPLFFYFRVHGTLFPVSMIDGEGVSIVSIVCYACLTLGQSCERMSYLGLLLDLSLTVKAAPHECVIRTSQP